MTSESHQIDSITEIPSECQIHEKHPLFIKIQTWLRGAYSIDKSEVKRASLYVELPTKVQFWQTWDDDTYLVFNSIESKFLTPVEILVIIRETNNRQIRCAEKTPGLKQLNFVENLKADPRVFNSPEFKDIKFSRDKEIEYFNIANQCHSELVKLPLELQIEEIGILEARLKLGKELLFKQGIRIQENANKKSREEFEQDRLNRASGFKTNKKGQLVPLTKSSNKATKTDLNLQLKYGSQVIKMLTALKLEINEDNCIKFKKQLEG